MHVAILFVYLFTMLGVGIKKKETIYLVYIDAFTWLTPYAHKVLVIQKFVFWIMLHCLIDILIMSFRTKLICIIYGTALSGFVLMNVNVPEI